MVKSVLLIEQSSPCASLVKRAISHLDEEPFAVEHARKCSEGQALLARDTKGMIAAVIANLYLPDTQGLQTLERIFTVAPRIPLLVLTSSDHEAVAKQAMQRGAQDYILQHRLDTYLLPKMLRNMLYRSANVSAVLTEMESARAAMNSIRRAVISTDAKGLVSYLNHVAEAMTGWTLAESIGLRFSEVCKIVDGADSVRLDPIRLATQFQRSSVSRPGCSLIRRDGTKVTIEALTTPIHDRRGKLLGATMEFGEPTQPVFPARELSYLPQFDSLTGLPSRVLLNDRLSKALSYAERHEEGVAILCIGLDRFEQVIESAGRPGGDQLVRSVSKRLLESVRSSDTVSRVDADEFVVVLTGLTKPQNAAFGAQALLKALGTAHRVDQQDLRIPAAIGIGVYPDDGTDPQTLIANARLAMLGARQHGGGGFNFFKPHLNEQEIERRFLDSGIRHGLARQEFLLHYQPILELRNETLVGVEALIRWRRPNGSVQLPPQFIPGAEQSGGIVALGQWVLREACRQAHEWNEAGLQPMTMAVNVSAPEMASGDFIPGIRSALQDTGLDPRHLRLEITEATLLKDIELSSVLLHTLQDMGVGIALDRYGTGSSSLSHLRRFALDALKIDTSLIGGLCANPGDASAVNTVISTGKNFHLRVIAQGVETTEQLAALHEWQCDEGQGYFIHPPAPADEIACLLSRRMSPGLDLPRMATKAGVAR